MCPCQEMEIIEIGVVWAPPDGAALSDCRAHAM
jgi:hypothetical protein